MIQKIGILLIAMLACTFAFAGDEEGKDKNKDSISGTSHGIKIINPDSLTKDKIDIAVSNDDTLVFEDWEEPDDAGTDNSGIAPDGDMDGDGVNDDAMATDAAGIIGNFLQSRESRYQVSFQVYPNPTSDVIHIKTNTNPQLVEVKNMMGETLYMSDSTDPIDVSGQASGTYLINLVYHDHIETVKFVKVM